MERGDQDAGTRAHHPFTSPHEDDIIAGALESDKGAVRALAYDIVLNGTELGSGSIRIHRQDVQPEIFRSLGMTDEEAKERFGFFLDALEYGTPPHGGIALGLDRIVMILAGADQPARGDRVPQDGQGHRPDGGRAVDGPRGAAEGAAHPACGSGLTAPRPRMPAISGRGGPV